MTRLDIILLAVATVSTLSTIFLFVYSRAILARLLFISEELGDLQDMTDGFAKHLQSIYELETFYGDQPLQGLLEHAVSYNEQLETFEWIYSLTAEEEEHNTEDEQADDTETDAEAQNSP